MDSISNSDWLAFFGAMGGAAITVWGSLWIVNYTEWKHARRDQKNLLSFLAMLEGKLLFTKNDFELERYVAARNVPSLINTCALVLEMADLLNTPAVAQAAKGYVQLYSLHRLRRILNVWKEPFAEFADIPYTDFYVLSSATDFEAAVAKLIVPSAIIRGSVHLYIAAITGRNSFLEEIQAEFGPSQWDPDNPYVPQA